MKAFLAWLCPKYRLTIQTHRRWPGCGYFVTFRREFGFWDRLFFQEKLERSHFGHRVAGWRWDRVFRRSAP